MIYHIQKDSWSLDDQNPAKKCLTFFNFFHWLERPVTQIARVPPYEFRVFPTNFVFCLQNEKILRGKSILPFSKFIIRKIQIFSTHSYMTSHRYTQICGRGSIYAHPPMGQLGLMSALSLILFFLHTLRLIFQKSTNYRRRWFLWWQSLKVQVARALVAIYYRW